MTTTVIAGHVTFNIEAAITGSRLQNFIDTINNLNASGYSNYLFHYGATRTINISDSSGSSWTEGTNISMADAEGEDFYIGLNENKTALTEAGFFIHELLHVVRDLRDLIDENGDPFADLDGVQALLANPDSDLIGATSRKTNEITTDLYGAGGPRALRGCLSSRIAGLLQ